MTDPDVNPHAARVRSLVTRRRLVISAGGSALGFGIARSVSGSDDDYDDDHEDSHEGHDDSDDRDDRDRDKDDIRPSGTVPAGSMEVVIDDDDADGFEPGTITIDAGQSVTWVNLDDDPHTATGAGFDTGRIEPGAQATVTFNEPGTFPYSCHFHPIMVGTVEVRDESGQVPGGVTGSPEASPAATPKATPSVPTGNANDVTIADFAFDPAEMEVTAGSTVRWTNRDAAPHTATSSTNAFDSGPLDQDDTFEHTFDEPGTYDYFCAFHPNMEGRITVTG